MTTTHPNSPALLAAPALRAVVCEVIAYDVVVVFDDRKGFLADLALRKQKEMEDVLSLALDAPVRVTGVRKEPAPCSHHCSQHQ